MYKYFDLWLVAQLGVVRARLVATGSAEEVSSQEKFSSSFSINQVAIM